MIVENLKGERLELKKGKLTELDKKEMSCYTTFTQIKRAFNTGRFRVWFVDNCPKYAVSLSARIEKYNLGCCLFSPETFAKILKAAGVPVRKTKARKARKTKARKGGK